MSRSDRRRKGTNTPWNVEPPIEALEPRLSLTSASWPAPDLLPDPITASDDAATLAVPPPPTDSAIPTINADASPVESAEVDAVPVVETTTQDDLVLTASGAPAAVVQDGQGVIVAAFNRFDTLTSFDLEGEELTWSVDENIAGHPLGENAFAGYRDPVSGEARLAAAGRDGLVLLARDRAGRLAELPGLSPTITRAITAFVSADGRAHVAGLTDDGALLVSYERLVPGASGLERQWTTADLGAHHLGARGIETPRFAGPLTSFSTPWGGMNIVGADADGQVWSVWWAPGMRLWTASNLTRSAQGDVAPIVGGLAAMGAPRGAIHLFGTDARGHLHALSWSANDGAGAWTGVDLTRTTGSPALRAGSLTGFRSSWNTLSVFGLDDAGDVRATWWTPRVGRWISESVSAELPANAPRITGPLGSFVARDGTQNLVGSTAMGEIVRLSWTPDGTDAWHAENLSARARGFNG